MAVRELRRTQLLNDVLTLRLSGKPDGLPMLGDGPTLRPTQSEQEAAFQRTVGWLTSQWLPHSEAKVAIRRRRAETGQSPEEVKREALRFGLWTALGAANEEQESKLGRNKLRRLGDRVVYQEQDLKALDRLSEGNVEALPAEVVERLTRPPVGERTHLLREERGPIEGALLGDYSEAVRPADLDPEPFLHWLRRRAIDEARDRLLASTGTVRESVQRDLERAERAEEQGVYASQADQKAARRAQKAAMELEDLRDSNRGALEWVDPEEAALMRVGLQNLAEEMTESEREKVAPMLELLREVVPRSVDIRDVADELGSSEKAFYTAFSRMRDRYENPL